MAARGKIIRSVCSFSLGESSLYLPHSSLQRLTASWIQDVRLLLAEFLSQLIQEIREAAQLFIISLIDHRSALLCICKLRFAEFSFLSITHGSCCSKRMAKTCMLTFPGPTAALNKAPFDVLCRRVKAMPVYHFEFERIFYKDQQMSVLFAPFLLQINHVRLKKWLL